MTHPSLSNLSSLNLVFIFRFSTSPHNLVYPRRVDPSGLPSLSSHRVTDTHVSILFRSLCLFRINNNVLLYSKCFRPVTNVTQPTGNCQWVGESEWLGRETWRHEDRMKGSGRRIDPESDWETVFKTVLQLGMTYYTSGCEINLSTQLHYTYVHWTYSPFYHLLFWDIWFPLRDTLGINQLIKKFSVVYYE